MLALLATVVFVFLIFLALQFILLHLLHPASPSFLMVRLMVFCTFLLYPAYVWIRPWCEMSFIPPAVQFLLYAGAVFALGWFLYVDFYFVFERSPTMRLLVDVLDLDQGRGVSYQELDAQYSAED